MRDRRTSLWPHSTPGNLRERLSMHSAELFRFLCYLLFKNSEREHATLNAGGRVVGCLWSEGGGASPRPHVDDGTMK